MVINDNGRINQRLYYRMRLLLIWMKQISTYWDERILCKLWEKLVAG